MRVGILALFLAGCTLAEPSGDPLSPVQPAEPAVAPPPATSVPEDFRITSEELQENAAEARARAEAPPSPFGEQGAEATSAAAPAEATPVVAEPAPAEPAPPTAVEIATPPEQTQAAPSPWPVRLVKTVPEAQPPRAIVALPDGREVVVTPGMLLADQGLVVLAVGRASLDLAQVRPAGDHAQISPITLVAQY